MTEMELKYGCNPNQKPSRIFMADGGDLPITVQPDLLKILDAEKRLGITLNASYMMSPSKSVTAVIGIVKEPGSV